MPQDCAARTLLLLDLRTKLVLMKSVAHSLKILHDLSIVHGDLKPSNILIKRTELGYTSKLIDFDNSYIAASPPQPEEIVGTINYYSPELLGYIQEDGVAPAALGVASDVFALGLIYCEYLTGSLPPLRHSDLPRGSRRGPEWVRPFGAPDGRTTRSGGSGRRDAARRPRKPSGHGPCAFHPDGLPACRFRADTTTAVPTALRGKGLGTRRSGAEQTRVPVALLESWSAGSGTGRLNEHDLAVPRV